MAYTIYNENAYLYNCINLYNTEPKKIYNIIY